MSAMQRTKGQKGEREAAGLIEELTGWKVRRRVRQHDGDSDLVGVPGWSVEVKRAKEAHIAAWWRQAVQQAAQDGTTTPVLVYRIDRRDWRAVWPSGYGPLEDLEWAVEGPIQVWAAKARDEVQCG